MPSSSLEARDAFSVLEVLCGFVLLALCLVPLLDLSIRSCRTGAAAQRLSEAALHGQTLLEVAMQLQVSDLPALAVGESVGIPSPACTSPAGRRLASLAASPPPFPMERRLTAERGSERQLVLIVELAYAGISSEPRSAHKLVFQGLAAVP